MKKTIKSASKIFFVRDIILIIKQNFLSANDSTINR